VWLTRRSATNSTIWVDGFVAVWHHLAGVWDGGEQRFYIDGRLVAQESVSLGSLNPRTLRMDEARLGITAKSFNSENRYYHGDMDEFVLFSRALDEEEIGELMNRGIAEMSQIE
jgi:hypothetical protein